MNFNASKYAVLIIQKGVIKDKFWFVLNEYQIPHVQNQYIGLPLGDFITKNIEDKWKNVEKICMASVTNLKHPYFWVVGAFSGNQKLIQNNLI